jgi:hypothetical protein
MDYLSKKRSRRFIPYIECEFCNHQYYITDMEATSIIFLGLKGEDTKYKCINCLNINNYQKTLRFKSCIL